MFRDCNYPKFINFLLSLNAGLFLYMFGNFYYQNYVKSRRLAQKAKEEGQTLNSQANGDVQNSDSVATESNGKLANGVESNGKVINRVSNGKVVSGITNGKITNGVQLNGNEAQAITANGKLKEC